MLYPTADDWLNAPQKRVVLFGMSGLGKTHAATLLRRTGKWFHYNIDYRIGTRYMGELIADDFKRAAMQVPYLRELLLSDSIHIGSNITFDNLAPLSGYLGKPGDPTKGGLDFETYMQRQEEHRVAEIAALMDSGHFIARAKALYGQDNVIIDTGGSICEVVNPEDPDDPVLDALTSEALLVWIKGTEAHTKALVKRFDRAPKPMYYQEEFLRTQWAAYLELTDAAPGDVDPDAFIRWTYARALAHRQPRYAAMARRGVTVTADEMAGLKSERAFTRLIARAIARQTTPEES